MVLVAGSAYLLGSSRVSEPTNTFTQSETLPVENSIVSDIAQTLASPAATTTSSTGENTASIAQPISQVSLNSGSQAELETLKGIGPSKAKAIIDYRNQFGQFIRIEDVQKVKGIGPKTFENIKAQITL